MSTRTWQRLCVKDQVSHHLLDAWYSLGASSIDVRCGDETSEIDIDAGPEGLIHTIKDSLGESASLVCCVDCVHFEQSGMSREMDTPRGQCGVHSVRVDPFFHCDQFCSQDALRPKWDPGQPDLIAVEGAFSQWLGTTSPFVVFQYGTILVEDPNTKSGDYRCRTLLPSLINVPPSISVKERDESYVVEHLGFVYGIVTKVEWARNGEEIRAAISAFSAGIPTASPPIKLPSETHERDIAILWWCRFVKDARTCHIAHIHRSS